MYFHNGECVEKYYRHKEFLKKEKKEKDELFYMLIKLHKLEKTSDIPPLFYRKIEDLRNDNWILGKYDKKYKQGVSYRGIHYTYDYCKEEIQIALTRMADRPIIEQMAYCLGIVRNNVVDAFKNAKNNAKQKEHVNKLMENIEDMSEVRAKIKQVQINSNKEDKEEIDLLSLFD